MSTKTHSLETFVDSPIDVAWGIERDKRSRDYGKVVVGTARVPILMWLKPGKPTQENLGGAVLHGQTVTVKGRKRYKGTTFFMCECIIEYNGKLYPQRGYIAASLLKERGEKFRR